MTRNRIGFCSIFLLLASVSLASAAVPQIARDAETVLRQHCYKCHGENGVATAGLNVLKWRQLTGPKGPIVAKIVGESKLYQLMSRGAMPPADDKRVKRGLVAKEIATIHKWILAGAPSFETPLKREFISPRQVLAFIQSDLVNKVAVGDRQYMRYFTLTHLYNAGVRDDEIATYRLAISKLANSLSWNREIVVPKAVDPKKTICRIDLRDYDWDVRQRGAIFSVWDAIIAKSPYNAQYPGEAAVYCAKQTGQKIPYVRGDWFVAAASRPPLYYQILEIPRTSEELEKHLGVNVAANIARETVVRAGFTNSGVSDNNRLIERHRSRYGAYWKSYDFAGNKGRQLLSEYPLGPGNDADSFKHEGGEIIFNLPNGFQAYMLVNAKGERIDKGPLNIVRDRDDIARDGGAVVNGISCMHCHDQGMNRKDDEIRPDVLKNAVRFRGRRKVEASILALYPEKAELDQYFDQDADKHIRAAEKAGSPVVEDLATGKSKLVDAKPIVRLFTQSQSELDLKLAAAEAGVRPDALKKVIDDSPTLVARLGRLRIPGLTIKRDTYVDAYAQIINEINDGNYADFSHLGEALTHYNNGQVDKAIVELGEAIKLDATDYKAYRQRGFLYAEARQYDKAISDYSAAILKSQKYAQAHYERGLAFRAKGQNQQAIADFSAAILIESNYALAYHDRGVAYDHAGQYGKAIEDYTSAIKHASFIAGRVYNHRGLAYHHNEKYEEAIADYNRAIKRDPNDAEAHNNRGNSLVKVTQYAEAIEDYTEAIRIKRNYAKAYYNRGLVYSKKKEVDKAIADYTAAIRIESDYAKAYSHRGLAHINMKAYDKAIADYTEAIKCNPNDAAAYNNRGTACYITGKYDSAIADYTAAIRLKPGFAKAYHNRAIAYQKKGDKPRARADLAKAKELGFKP